MDNNVTGNPPCVRDARAAAGALFRAARADLPPPQGRRLNFDPNNQPDGQVQQLELQVNQMNLGR